MWAITLPYLTNYSATYVAMFYIASINYFAILVGETLRNKNNKRKDADRNSSTSYSVNHGKRKISNSGNREYMHKTEAPDIYSERKN